jgi:hypothetical protein
LPQYLEDEKRKKYIKIIEYNKSNEERREI